MKSRNPAFSMSDGVADWFYQEILSRFVKGGVPALTVLFTLTEDNGQLPKDTNGNPVTWFRFQSEWLGMFLGVHYFWEHAKENVVPVFSLVSPMQLRGFSNTPLRLLVLENVDGIWRDGGNELL